MRTHLGHVPLQPIIGSHVVSALCILLMSPVACPAEPRLSQEDRATESAAAFHTVATPQVSISLDSEGSVSEAILTRFVPDRENSSLREMQVRIDGKADLEQIRLGLLEAVRPVFVSHPGAEAGAVHVAKLAVAVNERVLTFWVFDCGFSLTPQAVQGNLFFSPGLAGTVNRLFAANRIPHLPAFTMEGLSPPHTRTEAGAPGGQREGIGPRGPGSL